MSETANRTQAAPPGLFAWYLDLVDGKRLWSLPVVMFEHCDTSNRQAGHRRSDTEGEQWRAMVIEPGFDFTMNAAGYAYDDEAYLGVSTARTEDEARSFFGDDIQIARERAERELRAEMAEYAAKRANRTKLTPKPAAEV